jgi:hypothetical protein
MLSAASTQEDPMQRSRRVAIVTATAVSLTAVSAFVGLAAASGGVLGFGGSSASTSPVSADLPAAAVSPPSPDAVPTSVAPIVVQQYEYEDQYVYVRRHDDEALDDHGDDDHADDHGDHVESGDDHGTDAAPATAPQAAPSTTVAPPTTAATTRPPVPDRCGEPEWDREHQRWHCEDD